MISDLRYAANDCGDWADLDQRPDGETICSQVLEEIKTNWEGWENDKSMKLAELIDIRNGGRNIRFTLKEARDLLLWGFQEVLPLIRVPKAQAEPATGEAPAAGGGRRRARAGAPIQPLAKKAISNFATDSDAEEVEEVGGLEQFARESASYLSLLNSFENADSLDPLMFFYERRAEFPILKTLADSLLAVQSTSAASESFFSEGRRTITDERSGLQPRRAARLIVSRIRHKIRLVGSPQLFYMFPNSITTHYTV